MTAWNIRPIVSALWRNRTGAILVALQIAIGLAVLVNAVYVVKQRVDKISRPTGMDTANMIWVASSGFAEDYDYDATWREDLAICAACPASRRRACSATFRCRAAAARAATRRSPGEVGPKETVPGNKYDVDEARSMRSASS